MQDLMEKLQSILSTKEGQDQLNNIAKMLNMNDNQPDSQTNQQENANQNSFNQQGNQNTQQGSGFDMSSLAGLFSNQQNNQSESNSDNNNSFDFSSLASMFSNMSSNSNNEQNNQGNNEQSGMPNIDINMIMKMQQIFSKMNVSDKNSKLLLSLKPHFGDKRRQKVDQAISLMRLISILPAIKDSGMFPKF